MIANDCTFYHQVKTPIGFGVGDDWTLYLLFNYQRLY